MHEPIDFVICWVEGSDPEWIKEKRKHLHNENSSSASENRYRDWENLQYWFRAIEKFTPWVNKVHFVTWGHIPAWLNTTHPKLNIVNHEDYIPKEYLPTFSSRPIELNIHRIDGLADQFVYFNDDMFIIRPMKKQDFFKNGKPVDSGIFDVGIKSNDAHGYAVVNSIMIINKYFTKKGIIKKNWFKWFNPRNGKNVIRNILLYPWKYITGFFTPHLPNSFLRSSFYKVWEIEHKILSKTSKNKFRTKEDVNQYLFKFWQLASGNFQPGKSDGRLFSIGKDFLEIKECIEKQKYGMICINDSAVKAAEFDKKKGELIRSFDVILPNKSKYEL